MKYIFIGGCPRSGTTFFQLLLHQTGLVATAPETHLFPQFVSVLHARWAALSSKKKSGHRDVGLHTVITEKEFHDVVRRLTDTVFSKIAAKHKDCQYVCEKTPENILSWKQITAYYPKAVLFNVIRDPRAVFASVKASRSWAAEWATIEIPEFCKRWNIYAQATVEMKEAGVTAYNVRFEKLLQDEGKYLDWILKLIGIKLPPKQLQEICQRTKLSRIKLPHQPGSWPWDLKREPEGFFRTGEVDSWKHELPVHEIALIEHLTSEQMQKFGYPISLKV